jgi:hypothetical protein
MKITRANKVDLLIAVDNSRSMADKQAVLAKIALSLVGGFANPPCVDATGAEVDQPATPDAACATGTRAHAPVTDIHAGVITSSLGSRGSDACSAETFSCNGAMNSSTDDGAHLVSRTDPCAPSAVPTYDNGGFLAWDPKGVLSPPGESDLDTLATNLASIITGAGQLGCGYEAQLESWYRFLIQPDPYASVTVDAGFKSQENGTDQVVLDQRAKFLRPDSMVVVVMLTDENDCSVKTTDLGSVVMQVRDPTNPNKSFHLPRARSECAVNAADPCCSSCGLATPVGCPDNLSDPECAKGGPLPDADDDINLRCFDQKRRFGIDFLEPTSRYVQGLQSSMVPDRAGAMVPNPLFVPVNGAVRDPSLVMLVGIVGVPWQDLSRDPKSLASGTMNAAELEAKDASGYSRWDHITGLTPDPHLLESTSPRSGTNPIDGAMLAPPSSPPGADAINGHEYSVGTYDGVFQQPDDLEYVCIFDKPMPEDCSTSTNGCDCVKVTDKPVCSPNPNDGGKPTLQTAARAYPGTRQLEVLHGLGAQAVVGSVCPAQLSNTFAPDFAYAPVARSVREAARTRLQ